LFYCLDLMKKYFYMEEENDKNVTGNN